MDKTEALNILKSAILFERKGKAFYEQAAKSTRSDSLRKVFEMMGTEEDGHVGFLSAQYRKLENTGRFDADATPGTAGDFAVEILTESVRKEVSAAGYEAAAISAALAMEDRAVKFYGDRAAASDDDAERRMYQWLSDWEKTHLHLLTRLDRELTESVWNDNRFWPMD